VTTAFVVAGGKGTRLGALGSRRPKCLCPVSGRPLLAHILSVLERAPLERVVVTILDEFADQLHCFLRTTRSSGLPVLVSQDPAATGSLCSLQRAVDGFEGARQDALIWLGDIVGRVDVDQLMSLHHSGRHTVTLAVHNRDDYGASGVLDVRGQVVHDLWEKPGWRDPGPRPVWAGVAVVEVDAVRSASGTDLARDLFAPLCGPQEHVGAYVLDASGEQLMAVDYPRHIAAAAAMLRRLASCER
jgi:NDP-sugar pyrophosphorylase family protein